MLGLDLLDPGRDAGKQPLSDSSLVVMCTDDADLVEPIDVEPSSSSSLPEPKRCDASAAKSFSNSQSDFPEFDWSGVLVEFAACTSFFLASFAAAFLSASDFSQIFSLMSFFTRWMW